MISIKHLRKDFENVTPLKDICMEINGGEKVAIIGPSGTGKSTLLRCINGLETATSGEIVVEGKTGMVFQSFNLFPHLNVLENVILGPMELKGMSRNEAIKKGMSLLEDVGLAEKANVMPAALSGGQKQRVAIARTLAMDPDIILFDEPTSALDPTMVGEVMTVMRKLTEKELTILIVTHDMRLAREVPDRVLYLDEGIVYEDGTPKQIFDSPTKKLTRAFVKRMKFWEINIEKSGFDYIEAMNSLDQFARSMYRSAAVCRKLQLLFEELTMTIVLPEMEDSFRMKVRTEISEEDNSVVMQVEWEGKEHNPLDGGDEIALKLIKSITEQLHYRYTDGMNRIEAQLVSD